MNESYRTQREVTTRQNMRYDFAVPGKRNMDPKAVSPVPRVRHRGHSASQVTRGRRLSVAVPAASLQHLTAKARQCRTPKQFHDLLNTLQPILPFQRLICAWGYSSRESIRFI